MSAPKSGPLVSPQTSPTTAAARPTEDTPGDVKDESNPESDGVSAAEGYSMSDDESYSSAVFSTPESPQKVLPEKRASAPEATRSSPTSSSILADQHASQAAVQTFGDQNVVLDMIAAVETAPSTVAEGFGTNTPNVGYTTTGNRTNPATEAQTGSTPELVSNPTVSHDVVSELTTCLGNARGTGVEVAAALASIVTSIERTLVAPVSAGPVVAETHGSESLPDADTTYSDSDFDEEGQEEGKKTCKGEWASAKDEGPCLSPESEDASNEQPRFPVESACTAHILDHNVRKRQESNDDEIRFSETKGALHTTSVTLCSGESEQDTCTPSRSSKDTEDVLRSETECDRADDKGESLSGSHSFATDTVEPRSSGDFAESGPPTLRQTENMPSTAAVKQGNSIGGAADVVPNGSTKAREDTPHPSTREDPNFPLETAGTDQREFSTMSCDQTSNTEHSVVEAGSNAKAENTSNYPPEAPPRTKQGHPEERFVLVEAAENSTHAQQTEVEDVVTSPRPPSVEIARRKSRVAGGHPDAENLSRRERIRRKKAEREQKNAENRDKCRERIREMKRRERKLVEEMEREAEAKRLKREQTRQERHVAQQQRLKHAGVKQKRRHAKRRSKRSSGKENVNCVQNPGGPSEQRQGPRKSQRFWKNKPSKKGQVVHGNSSPWAVSAVGQHAQFAKNIGADLRNDVRPKTIHSINHNFSKQDVRSHSARQHDKENSSDANRPRRGYRASPPPRGSRTSPFRRHMPGSPLSEPRQTNTAKQIPRSMRYPGDVGNPRYAVPALGSVPQHSVKSPFSSPVSRTPWAGSPTNRSPRAYASNGSESFSARRPSTSLPRVVPTFHSERGNAPASPRRRMPGGSTQRGGGPEENQYAPAPAMKPLASARKPMPHVHAKPEFVTRFPAPMPASAPSGNGGDAMRLPGRHGTVPASARVRGPSTGKMPMYSGRHHVTPLDLIGSRMAGHRTSKQPMNKAVGGYLSNPARLTCGEADQPKHALPKTLADLELQFEAQWDEWIDDVYNSEVVRDMRRVGLIKHAPSPTEAPAVQR